MVPRRAQCVTPPHAQMDNCHHELSHPPIEKPRQFQHLPAATGDTCQANCPQKSCCPQVTVPDKTRGHGKDSAPDRVSPLTLPQPGPASRPNLGLAETAPIAAK